MYGNEKIQSEFVCKEESNRQWLWNAFSGSFQARIDVTAKQVCDQKLTSLLSLRVRLKLGASDTVYALAAWFAL